MGLFEVALLLVIVNPPLYVPGLNNKVSPAFDFFISASKLSLGSSTFVTAKVGLLANVHNPNIKRKNFRKYTVGLLEIQ